MEIFEAARLAAAVNINPSPEPGHRLAIETEAERLVIEEPEVVEAVRDSRRIALVLRGWR